jgi:hypothetical protein
VGSQTMELWINSQQKFDPLFPLHLQKGYHTIIKGLQAPFASMPFLNKSGLTFEHNQHIIMHLWHKFHPKKLTTSLWFILSQNIQLVNGSPPWFSMKIVVCLIETNLNRTSNVSSLALRCLTPRWGYHKVAKN